MTTPAIRALKESHSSRRITLLVLQLHHWFQKSDQVILVLALSINESTAWLGLQAA